VQRSSLLIKFCKDKLRNAENAINQVFNEENCEEPTKSEKGAGGTLFQ
jgi:exodeoxyribonuclease VII small subunit